MNRPNKPLFPDDSLFPDDPKWGKPWRWSATHYNATHSFGNTYLKRDETDERRDGFYVPSKYGLPITIMLALRLKKPQCNSTQLNNQENIPSWDSTVRIVPRLYFPVEEDNLDKYGWESRDKRDLAAAWIEGNFDKLQSEKLLTACIARSVTHLLRGEIGVFLRSLGSVLRDPALAPKCVGSPAPTFIPADTTLLLSRLAAVTVGGIDSTLKLRESLSTQTPSEWLDGQLYSGKLSKEDRAALNPEMSKGLKTAIEKIKSEGDTYEYPIGIERCMFGSVLLWGQDETRPDASSSTAAN